MMADRALTRLRKEYPDIEIEKVDVMTSPALAWSEGIRMVPALKSGNKTLSGLFLSEESMRKFMRETGCDV